MSLSDLASLGSFVSGFAVLVSLVVLYFQLTQLNAQVRQTEKNQQAVIRQARSTRTVDIVLTGTEHSFAEAWAKVRSGELSASGLNQLNSYWRATFYNWEDAFYQHRDGLLTEHAFSAVTANVRSIVRNVVNRAQWRMQRASFGPEFVAWLDELVAQTPSQEQADIMVLWNDALAAERSGAPYT